VLSHVPRQHTPPLHLGGLRCGPASLGSRPHPASEVGSGTDICLMALYEPWAVEIKKGIAVMASSKACVFLRHA
jgi:hypothetical protein